MVGERPGVPLTPEAVHEGVHELDERVAVELRGQERVQLAERVLEERVVVARLLVHLLEQARPALPLPALSRTIGTLARTKSGRAGSAMSGALIMTRNPTRLPYCFVTAKTVVQYASGSRRPGRF